MTQQLHKLWGGRFDAPTANDMAAFNDSYTFDCRLADADITGSIAWAQALEHAGLITADERQTLHQGLEQIRNEFANGSFVSQPGDEDIHTAIERRLVELVGTTALKLHTGRSRNDQVATDIRIYSTHIVETLTQRVRHVQQALVTQATEHTATLMPGYTHLQRAQPITFGHWCLAYVEMFERDYQRLHEIGSRIRTLPLGSGALAGNSLGVDRAALLESLPMFNTLTRNSLDAISDRDFVAELLFCCSMIGVHLSRLAEDVIIYSSTEFGFIELADAYSTGSSLMPQKKNPDSMELLRGKSGRLFGNLVSLLTVLKGLPLAYNKDLQEDKEPLFDSFDTLHLALRVAAATLATMQVNRERMVAALDDAMLATDLADELVQRGVPFREAHSMVGVLVRRSLELGVSLRDMPLDEYLAVYTDFDAQVFTLFDQERSVTCKASIGGTAPEQVMEQVRLWQDKLES